MLKNLKNGFFSKVGVTWTRLSQTANAGDTTIMVKDSVDSWQVGSEVVIAMTGDNLSQGQSEVRIITAVNQNEITLDSPLNYTHLSVNRIVHDTNVTIQAEVGLLSRNILFQGNFKRFL